MRTGRGANVSSERWGATVLLFSCAASAGAHGGLVPAHLGGEPRLAAAFIAAVVLLAAAAAAIAVRPGDRRILSMGGVLLAGLMVAYLASRSTGIPVLDPEPEPVDVVGAATNAVEVLGILVALWLIHRLGRRTRLTQNHLQEVSQ